MIPISSNKRYVFKGWYDNYGYLVSKRPFLALVTYYPIQIEAKWAKQYYVNVISNYGKVQGVGWYDENSTARLSINAIVIKRSLMTKRYEEGTLAKLSISNTVVQSGFVKHVFTGWYTKEGKLISTSPQIIIEVNCPLVIEVKWKDVPQLGIIFSIIAVIIVVITAVLIILMRTRRKKRT